MKSNQLFLYIILLFYLSLPFYSCEDRGLPNFISNTRKTIAIQPFKGFPSKLIPVVQAAIDSLYDVEVTVLNPISLPQSTFYIPRQRYRADSLIRYLKAIKPSQYDKIIGLTHKDISTTKGGFKDYGIMGLGFRPGPSSIISIYRIKRGATNTPHLHDRLSKVVCHELGHNFNLPHCPHSLTCIMRSARGKASNIDSYDFDFCDNCTRKISSVLK